MKITFRVCFILRVPHPDDSREKSRIHYSCRTLWSFGGLRGPEFVQQIIVDQLGPIYFVVLHSGDLIMAAYFAGQALVKVGKDVAPLSGHPGAFDGVGDFPDLFIPLVANLIQQVHKLGISGKGFLSPCVGRLGRELKNVPEVPQRDRKFFQVGFVSL